MRRDYLSTSYLDQKLIHVTCMCDRINLRGNRTPDPWHTSPHSKAINERQLPLTNNALKKMMAFSRQ